MVIAANGAKKPLEERERADLDALPGWRIGRARGSSNEVCMLQRARPSVAES
jgi:hypothetical protein